MNSRPSARSSRVDLAREGSAVGGDDPASAGPSASIVDRSMGEARRFVALALVGSAVLLAALLCAHQWSARLHEQVDARRSQAQQVAESIALANQRLTAAARMVSVTGERRWIDEHDRCVPVLAEALLQARSLATASTAAQFDAQTQGVEEALSDMREAAFEAANVGANDEAKAIFDSERYRDYTDRLTRASETLAVATVDAAREQQDVLNRRALRIELAVVASALMLGVVVWVRLSSRLKRSRQFLLGAEERIRRLATTDTLTGLANRTAFHEAIATSLHRCRRERRSVAVLMLDLDRFKPINDGHGHMVGDLVLKEVAQRLRRCLRGSEMPARYGGDEFVVAIEEHDDPQVAHLVAQRIAEAIAQPMTIGSLQVSVGTSIGIARFPDDAAEDDDLLRKADSALRRAKDGGRGMTCFYDRVLDEQVAEREALEHAMRDGIALGQFVPYYQPIVDLPGGAVQSLELLCRWNHPQRGLVMPMQFIPLAEKSGLIGPMMFSVLRQACTDLAGFPGHWRLSINLAPQQLLDASLVPGVLAVLDDAGICPSRLDVELTETALVSDTARAREVMAQMKDAGITVTLDDFGTGYSSLAYLAEMTFDKIKIDRSFVRTLHDRPESAMIVAAVVGLSRSLRVQTVAEGVESVRDAEVLARMGCTLAQGYLYGKPMPASAVLSSVPASAVLSGVPASAVLSGVPASAVLPSAPAATVPPGVSATERAGVEAA